MAPISRGPPCTLLYEYLVCTILLKFSQENNHWKLIVLEGIFWNTSSIDAAVGLPI